MLLAIDLHKDFVDKESVAVASVISLQPAGINGSELYAPEPDGFTADSDASFSEEILDVAVTQVESIVEPHGVADDFRRESVTLVGIHPAILTT